MTTAIKFGTSGWRAIVADEFTVANIRLAVEGIAAYVKTQPEPHRVLIGRDPRFLGESFVEIAAQELAAAGITPIVIPEAAPTPAIAYAVRMLKTSGAINFAASICLVTSGKAGAPSCVENLIPLYSGGLCEAVKLIAPEVFSMRTA